MTRGGARTSRAVVPGSPSMALKTGASAPAWRPKVPRIDFISPPA